MSVPYDGKLTGIALLSVFLMVPRLAFCGSGAWIKNTGGSWLVSGNWAAGLVAGGSEANAGFSSNNLLADATILLDGTRTVGSLFFRDTVASHNWVLNTGSGGVLILDVGTGMPTINVENQVAFLNVTIAGNKGLAKLGPGMLTLSGNNTYSGGTSVSGGVLQIAGANSLQGSTTIDPAATLWLNVVGANHANKLEGSGIVQISPASGATQLSGDLSGFSGRMDVLANGAGGKVLMVLASQASALSAQAAVSVKNGATVFLGSSETTVAMDAALDLTGTGNSENLGALRIEKGASWRGPVTLKSNSSIGTQTGVGTITGIIGEIGGSFGFTKQGAATLVLSEANTHTGATTLSGGTLCLSNARALQNSTLQLNGGGLVFDHGVSPGIFRLGGLSGAGDINMNDDSLDAAGIGLSVGGNHLSTSYSGSLGGAGWLEKAGNGVLTISGEHHYSGATVVSAGTLRLGRKSQLPANLQIMPLGDSITYGFNGSNAGYRGPLYNLLNPIAPGFQFIGTSVERPGSLPISPVDQRHNEGHSSYNLKDVLNNLDGFDNTRFLLLGGAERNPNGGHWLDGIPNVRAPMFPDVITMMVGTNDVDVLVGIDVRLHDIIEKITTLRPTARLLVAKVIPNTLFPQNTAIYNQVIASQVAAFQAMGRNVWLVDLNTDFPANGLFDAVHPNDVGFEFMAGKWRDAIIAAYSSGNVLPDSSPTTVVQGAVLDLDGLSATLGNLSGGGDIFLGNGGNLVVNANEDCIFSGSISGAGTVVKAGGAIQTLLGTASHSGSTEVREGVLRISGELAGTGTIEIFAGAAIELIGGAITAGSIHIQPGGMLVGHGTINSSLVNEGELVCMRGPIMISGEVTNSGLVRTAGSAIVQVGQGFYNYGTLDLINGSPIQAANLVNLGTILEPDLVKLESATKSDSSIQLSIQSYSGHYYQLQYSSDLEAEYWQDIGDVQAGVTGSVLNFISSVGATGERGFYRIRVTP